MKEHIKTPSILLLYTGGTIGMMENPATGALQPLDFSQIERYVPELQKLRYAIHAIAFDPPIDSSDMHPRIWAKIAQMIYDKYYEYDGFVILHGTDTMSFTASALSFMLENLAKPVILTGSQLPIGKIRTDGKENLITAVEVATAKHPDGKPLVSEVCIYFENKLYRGNRTTKYNAEHFNAFRSENYPPLAEAGVHIRYNHNALHKATHTNLFRIHTHFDHNVGLIKLFPGISQKMVEAVLNIEGLKAVVLETFGAGNASMEQWFLDAVAQAVSNKIIVLNVTQCTAGTVEMGRYETSVGLARCGVISGRDLTTEAAITKLMFLLGQNITYEQIIIYLQSAISGEMTVE